MELAAQFNEPFKKMHRYWQLGINPALGVQYIIHPFKREPTVLNFIILCLILDCWHKSLTAQDNNAKCYTLLCPRYLSLENRILILIFKLGQLFRIVGDNLLEQLGTTISQQLPTIKYKSDCSLVNSFHLTKNVNCKITVPSIYSVFSSTPS